MRIDLKVLSAFSQHCLQSQNTFCNLDNFLWSSKPDSIKETQRPRLHALQIPDLLGNKCPALNKKTAHCPYLLLCNCRLR